MKRIFKIENLDCANCAAKVEEKIREIKGIINVSVSFMGQKLTLEAPDDMFEKILSESQKVMKRVEPDAELIVK